ncbi:MAG TPA: hypothetical protein VKA48_08540 [Gammaproteobacteria bacterium]|nr:hypothetical protein [Gammaproteobacteria bacterium]
MPTSAELRTQQAQNAGRQCAVPGCVKNRHGIGHHCKAHGNRKRVFGHPEGRRIRRSEYLSEAANVTLFLTKHADHPGIEAADRFAENWLLSGGLSHVPGHTEVDRLRGAGVTPEDVINELLAIWLHLRWASKHVSWLGSEETQVRAIGTALLHLASRTHTYTTASGQRRYKVLPGYLRRDVGRYFVQALAPFAANVMAGIEADLQAKQAGLSALRQPFTSSGGLSGLKTSTRTRSIHSKR